MHKNCAGEALALLVRSWHYLTLWVLLILPGSGDHATPNILLLWDSAFWLFSMHLTLNKTQLQCLPPSPPIFPPLEFQNSVRSSMNLLQRTWILEIPLIFLSVLSPNPDNSPILSILFLLDFLIFPVLSLLIHHTLIGEFLAGHRDWCLAAGLDQWSHGCLWVPESAIDTPHFTLSFLKNMPDTASSQ